LRLQPVERRVERAGLDPQLLRRLLDVPRDGVAMRRTGAEGPQDEQLERALEELALRAFHCGDSLQHIEQNVYTIRVQQPRRRRIRR
jgi:hypothetical protein